MYDIRQNLLSSWLPPGGSCHDEISASRNRYFVVTDEGWRWLKVIDFPVEWRKPEHTPFIQLHSFTNLSPPLISLFYQPVPKRRLIKNPASPRGKPRALRASGSPTWRPLRDSKNFWLAATNVLHPLSQICRFRSAAKSDSSPRGGAKAASPLREAKSLPYNGDAKTGGRIPFNEPPAKSFCTITVKDWSCL